MNGLSEKTGVEGGGRGPRLQSPNNFPTLTPPPPPPLPLPQQGGRQLSLHCRHPGVGCGQRGRHMTSKTTTHTIQATQDVTPGAIAEEHNLKTANTGEEALLQHQEFLSDPTTATAGEEVHQELLLQINGKTLLQKEV